MRVLVLGDFGRSSEPPDSGSQVRTRAIAQELAASGYRIETAPRDLVPRSAEGLAQVASLPATLSRADAICIIGIPRRSSPYRLLAALARGKKPIVIDFNDDPVLQHEALMNKPHPRQATCQRLTRLLVEHATVVAFITDSMRSYYLSSWSHFKAITIDDTILVPNASDPRHFPHTPIPDNQSIGYVGGIAPGRGLELVADAVASLKSDQEGIQVLIGTDAPRQLYPSLAAKFRAAGVVRIVHGVNYNTMPDFVSRVRICVIPHLRNRYFDFIVPVKLFDYMAGARPILATSNSEQRKILQECGAGLVCEAETKEMANSLQRLLEDADLCTSLGKAGRKGVEERYNWTVATRALADRLSSLA